jgi:UDP-N-acetylmuramoyl-tripeptide--D-alanyl-D-alanine ligase
VFTLKDILQGNAGNVRVESSTTPDPVLTFREAHHDSRLIEPGDLFIARKGISVDGHRFIPAAARAGARGALCRELVGDVPPDFVQILVPDPVAALQATARVRTQRQHGTILLGITGSNGKTSTKDAVAAVLARKAPTLRTCASHNHEIGYPQTLLRLEPQHRYAVLEMGAQWVGELTWLCKTVATPHWSLITNVGSSHLEFFGSQERIALAKSELVQVLAPGGIAILNFDDVNVRAMAEKTQARVLFYGQGEGAEVRAEQIGGDILTGLSFTLRYHEQRQHVRLRLPGEHGVSIALAAAAAGCAAEISLEEIAIALEALVPAKGRGEIRPGPNGSTIIDDTYNANRQSILAIIRAMRASTRYSSGRKWAVLGDIFELGPFARDEHLACGAALASTVDYLVAIGEQARFYLEGAVAEGMPEHHVYYFAAEVEQRAHLEDAKRAAADLLLDQVRPGDLVLLKGSRGMRMETLLPLLHVQDETRD